MSNDIVDFYLDTLNNINEENHQVSHETIKGKTVITDNKNLLQNNLFHYRHQALQNFVINSSILNGSDFSGEAYSELNKSILINVVFQLHVPAGEKTFESKNIWNDRKKLTLYTVNNCLILGLNIELQEVFAKLENCIVYGLEARNMILMNNCSVHKSQISFVNLCEYKNSKFENCFFVLFNRNILSSAEKCYFKNCAFSLLEFDDIYKNTGNCVFDNCIFFKNDKNSIMLHRISGSYEKSSLNREISFVKEVDFKENKKSLNTFNDCIFYEEIYHEDVFKEELEGTVVLSAELYNKMRKDTIFKKLKVKF